MPTATSDPWAALADPTRRKVLALVARRPRSVAEIASELPVSRPAVSQHLRVLSDAELVAVRRDGRRHIYRARPEGLAAVRDELDRFWTEALSNFKRIAEAGDQEGNDQ